MTPEVERTEFLIPEPAYALAGLLGVQAPDLGAGGLPLMWHWLYLLHRAPQDELGEDGHPTTGFPAPPGPGKRRMWAGGMIRSQGRLLVGERATRRSTVLQSTVKHGRSGVLTFVRVGHTIWQRDELVVEEHQDIVYRDAPLEFVDRTAGTPMRAGPAAADQRRDEWSIPVSPTLLFRFSALTYNSHRIHYDRDYATLTEGYPGLVTHGPLQALAMAEALRARGIPTTPGLQCDYRLTSPLMVDQGLIVGAEVAGKAARAWARDRAGRQTAQATFTGLP